MLKSLQTHFGSEPSTTYHSPLSPTTKDAARGDLGHSGPSTVRHRRHSVATTVSDGTHEWHDAVDTMNDGPEEFVVDAQSSPEQPGPISHVTTIDSQSSLEQLDNSGDETDLEEESEPDQHTPRIVQDSKYDARTIVRRSQLPSRVAGDEGSLFAVLKKNVGKVLFFSGPRMSYVLIFAQDLSTITLPVTFNEPLTLLERLAEEVEYHNLLDEAVRAKNPVDRLSFVAAFAVSGYAHTRHRSGRKGL